ncbi:MAG: hypothetical protein ACK4P2_03130 [Hyphomonas sp.]
MIAAAIPSLETIAARPTAPEVLKADAGKEAESIKLRFEQMLWAEMLSHAGLEKAFTQGGGEAASAFSRYVVEAIAKDLAIKHPMGLAEGIEKSMSNAALTAQETPE